MPRVHNGSTLMSKKGQQITTQPLSEGKGEGVRVCTNVSATGGWYHLNVLLFCQGWGSAVAADPSRGLYLCCIAPSVLGTANAQTSHLGSISNTRGTVKAEGTGQACCIKQGLFPHALNVGMIAGNSDCCLDGTAGKSGTCSHRKGWASLGDAALDHKPRTVCYITI
jgi:hypothetical protein